ncbi:MAG TPA: hypothetical protein VKN35_13585, partial [Xanthomonadales bacterium]|nr:hypothetical protein [Xanthomonadales bacterium]
EVQEAMTAFEDRMIDEQIEVAATAENLFDAERGDLASAYLTRYSAERSAEALQIGHALLGSIEARTRLLYGLRRPEGAEMSALDYQMISCR